MLARYAPAGNKTLLTDALNSVIAQASDTQAIENYYAYSPYGEAQTLGPDGGNPLQYTGRENDGTGLMYYRARYYDPVLKRFVSEDPIGLSGGDTNFYAYVAGNPITRNDPEGLFWSGAFPAPTPMNLVQYLPAPVLNQLVNIMPHINNPYQQAQLINQVLSSYQYTTQIGWAINTAVRVSGVAGAAYTGWQIGGWVNTKIGPITLFDKRLICN